jgi:hypothetical protein
MVLAAFFLSAGFAKPELDEYQVKAMFLMNFIKYVDWSAYADENTVRIGIVGTSDITPALEKIAEYKRGGSKKIEIIRMDTDNPQLCNLLFVSREESGRIAHYAKQFAGRGMLIVSEDKSHQAGINLLKEDNKIKFEINQAAVKQAGLRLSVQLQALASTLNP